MEEALFRTMLFDSYGELLTEKQREYFDLHYNEDLSLAEIAQSEGVSRQSVWDIIRRAEETMRRFEEKTGLVARFAAERDILAAAQEKLARLETMTDGAAELSARDRRRITGAGTWHLKIFPTNSITFSKSSAARAACRSRT